MIVIESMKGTRWHNEEVDPGSNNFIEVTFKKLIMIKSFAYIAALNNQAANSFK